MYMAILKCSSSYFHLSRYNNLSVRDGKVVQTLAAFYHNEGKAVPLQPWSGPEGSKKLRFPDFMTTAQNGSKAVSLTHRPPLPPGNTPGTHFC